MLWGNQRIGMAGGEDMGFINLFTPGAAAEHVPQKIPRNLCLGN